MIRAYPSFKGGYDPRLQDNVETLRLLVEGASSRSLAFWICAPSGLKESSQGVVPGVPSSTAAGFETADIIFLLNFTTSQRSAMLNASSTLALLYTPANEHFGIGPVEAMACGVPVLACDSGGPTESVVSNPADARTGWLRKPVPEDWAQVLRDEILVMNPEQRSVVAKRSKDRVRTNFSMGAMAEGLESALYGAVAQGPVRAPSTFWVIVVSIFLACASLLYRSLN